MAKIYPSTEDSKSYKINKRVMIYSQEAGGYVVDEAYKIVASIRVNAEEFSHYMAENYSMIYPAFNKDIHSIYRNSDSVAGGGISHAVLTVREKLDAVTDMPYGSYRAVYSDSHGVVLKALDMSKSDTYIPIRQDGIKVISEDLKRFREHRDTYAQEGVRHKRGVLLYGPPGNGKTREISKILENAAADNLVTIFVPSSMSYLSYFDNIKSILSGKDVVFIIEELTERTSGRAMEDLLSFLDGEMSWNNAYIIATTNHPDEIPNNVIDRPGRFDLVVEFGNPNFDERVKYLQGRKYTEGEAIGIAALTDGLSLDYLAQLVTQCRVQGTAPSEYVKSNKSKRDKISKNFRPTMGLKNDSE